MLANLSIDLKIANMFYVELNYFWNVKHFLAIKIIIKPGIHVSGLLKPIKNVVFYL